MTKSFNKFLSRLANMDYLSAWSVLLLDLFLSFTGSVLALRSIEWITHQSLTPKLFFFTLFVCLLSSLLFFWVLKTYRKAIRHTTLSDVGLLLAASFLKAFFAYLLLLAYWKGAYGIRFLFFCGIADTVLTFVLLVCVRSMMIFVYEQVRLYFRSSSRLKRVLIYGTGDKSVAIVTRLQKSTHYLVLGFLEGGESNSSLNIADYPVYHFSDEESLRAVKSRLDMDGILFAIDSDVRKEQNRLVDYALKSDVSIFFAPGIDEVQGGNVTRQVVREIKIEDLLGRDEIMIDLERIQNDVQGKVIMVTGAAGSIGSELCRQLAQMGIGKLVLYDNAETPMHNLRLELEEKFPALHFVPVIGDVRQKARLDYAFRKWRPQIVFHAAAYKHVPLMEDNPCEAVLVNTVGSRQVADKCIEYNVEKMVMISTDKAVNPTNIMGCTKRLAEIYVQALGLAVASGKHEGHTRFVTTRFGNVLGSNGSVIPRFREQIMNGGPVTVTHPDINRFFMTIPEACRLVLEAACLGEGNQIFVFDMGKSVKIADLARRMIELAGYKPDEDIKIEFTGLRPGEKLYEEVLATAENTDSTSHERIRIARVRDYAYEDASVAVDRLEQLSRDVEIPEMVKYMKKVVPEFISQNSSFSEFDKH